MILMVYWDLSTVTGYRRLIYPPDTRIVSEGRLPMISGSDLFITHLQFSYLSEQGTAEIRVICQSERELSETDRSEISKGAIKYLNLPEESSPDA